MRVHRTRKPCTTHYSSLIPWMDGSESDLSGFQIFELSVSASRSEVSGASVLLVNGFLKRFSTGPAFSLFAPHTPTFGLPYAPSTPSRAGDGLHWEPWPSWRIPQMERANQSNKDWGEERRRKRERERDWLIDQCLKIINYINMNLF